MFLEKIKSEGLAHLSYILGDGRQAAVIDPRRDCQIYIEIAAREGARITQIFETHRNEDYVVGSLELKSRTGARIFHGKHLDFAYGQGVTQGDVFAVGDLVLEILETPGHTDESISIVVSDRNYGSDPVAVFTGDTLFVGEVGRTDFYPDRPRAAAGALYDSIFDKLLPLGDQTILLPAHGAGSVCGSRMASREFSTIGIERRDNPLLQKRDRDAFIDYKIREHHYQPPYFRRMEAYNLYGPPPMAQIPTPPPMSAEAVAEARDRGALLVDLRSAEAFAGAFIPGSLALPLDMVSAYAGYLIDNKTALVLIAETVAQVSATVVYFFRLGYDNVAGYLEGGMHAWETAGQAYDRISAVHAQSVSERLRREENLILLDVRTEDEFRQRRLKGATHIFLGELPDKVDTLDKRAPIVTFCGSGKRAIIAASILKRRGFAHVEDSLGSMQACERCDCAIIGEAAGQ